MTPQRLSLSLAFLLGVALVGVSRSESANRPYGVERAPASASQHVSPFENDPLAVAAGRKLFARHCAQCHGDSAEGRGRAPSLTTPRIHDAAPGSLLWLVTNGDLRTGMPAWSRLPEAQRWQLVAFLKSLPAAE